MSGVAEVGDRVFFNHPDDSWIMGTVRDIEGKYKVCEDENGQVTKTLEVHKVVQSSLQPVHDLLKMSYLHDSTLLHHVRSRYWDNIIYTNIGAIALAINPYDYTLPNYTDDKMIHYIKEGVQVLSQGSKQLPHSWSVAHQAYCLMRAKHENQAILVSGESGAGKTESVKIVMKYIGELSTAAADTKQREVFGALCLLLFFFDLFSLHPRCMHINNFNFLFNSPYALRVIFFKLRVQQPLLGVICDLRLWEWHWSVYFPVVFPLPPPTYPAACKTNKSQSDFDVAYSRVLW